MKASKNLTLMATMSDQGITAIELTEQCVDGSMMLSYFLNMVLPVIPAGSVVIMDNAPFHRSSKQQLEYILGLKGCNLLFLPPYSPDLNPIENAFGKIKILCRANWDTYLEDMPLTK